MEFIWVDKVNGVDDVSAEDINTIAHALKEVIEEGGGGGGDVPSGDIPTKLSELENDVGFIAPNKLTNELSLSGSTVAIVGGSVTIGETSYGVYCSNQRLQSVGNPTDISDAATKGYVDGLIGQIELAVDSMIATANALIGGDA